jgi:hypothetical protein
MGDGSFASANEEKRNKRQVDKIQETKGKIQGQARRFKE